MTTYFTSDLHIGHRLVAGIRGFWISTEDSSAVADVDAHSGAIATAWLSTVKSDDIVWVLGDLCVSAGSWSFALDLLSKLPGRKRLVCGNHDPVSSIHKDAWKYQRSAMEVFETVQDFATIKLAGKTVLLSHYPYSGVGAEGLRGEGQTQHEERYTEFRLTDCGRILLHGHTHGPERFHISDAGTPQVHVGLDAWGMNLVSQYEVEKLLNIVKSLLDTEPRSDSVEA